MATHNLLLLPGDGIGLEVMAEVKRVIDFFNKKGSEKFATEEALVGEGGGRRDIWRGRRAEVGQGAI